MRLTCTCAIVIAASSAVLAAQADKGSKKAPKPITVSGCVSRSAETNHYIIEDKTGAYELSGMDVRKFLGQRVQLVGGVVQTRKLRVSGGLKPSPNAAAQAGAIDPAQPAAMAGGGLAPTGTVDLPELRVRTIRPLGTGCEQH